MKNTLRFGGMPAAFVLAATLALGGCDAGTGPDERDLLTSEDADALAAFLSDVEILAVGVEALASSTGTRSFTRTASCPAGGSVSVSGSSESTRDDESHVVSTKWSTTQTHAACAIARTREETTVTAVIDGTVTTSGTSSWKLPEKRGDSRTLFSWTATKVGSTTTTVGDRKNTCEVNITQTWDPATQTFTVSGTMCGRQVNVTRGLGGRGG